jgi:hypothetical protein
MLKWAEPAKEIPMPDLSDRPDYSPLELDGGLMAISIVCAIATLDALHDDHPSKLHRSDFVHLLHLLQQDPAAREAAAMVACWTGHLPDLTDWKGRPWKT